MWLSQASKTYDNLLIDDTIKLLRRFDTDIRIYCITYHKKPKTRIFVKCRDAETKYSEVSTGKP